MAFQKLPSPNGHGWTVENGELVPILMSRDPAPKGLIELTSCHCDKSACTRNNCSCKARGIGCIESCGCMGGSARQNSYRLNYTLCSESDSDN